MSRSDWLNLNVSSRNFMLSQVVTSYLQERMPERIVVLDPTEERRPFIQIKPDDPEFDDIELYDDGDEVTIVFGRFTHSHFSNYDDIPVIDKEAQIAEDVYDILRDTFDDEVEFWGAHQGSGGYQTVDNDMSKKPGFIGRLLNRRASRTYYRWSGDTRTTKS